MVSGINHVIIKYDGSSVRVRISQHRDFICCVGCPQMIPLGSLIVAIDDGVVCCYACWKKCVDSFVHERLFYIKNLGVMALEDISKHISTYFLYSLPIEEFSLKSLYTISGELMLENNEFAKHIQLIYSDLVQSRFYSLPFKTALRESGAGAVYTWRKSVGYPEVHLSVILGNKAEFIIAEYALTGFKTHYPSIVDALLHVKCFIESQQKLDRLVYGTI
jgi:hypothetical protein